MYKIIKWCITSLGIGMLFFIIAGIVDTFIMPMLVHKNSMFLNIITILIVGMVFNIYFQIINEGW